MVHRQCYQSCLIDSVAGVPIESSKSRNYSFVHFVHCVLRHCVLDLLPKRQIVGSPVHNTLEHSGQNCNLSLYPCIVTCDLHNSGRDMYGIMP